MCASVCVCMCRALVRPCWCAFWSNAEALTKAGWLAPCEFLSIARLDLARKVAALDDLSLLGLIQKAHGSVSWTSMLEQDWKSLQAAYESARRSSAGALRRSGRLVQASEAGSVEINKEMGCEIDGGICAARFSGSQG